MKIKTLVLDKHLPVFGASSTLRVGIQNIEEMERADDGILLLKYDATKGTKKTVLVPWHMVKFLEVEKTSTSTKKSGK